MLYKGNNKITELRTTVTELAFIFRSCMPLLKFVSVEQWLARSSGIILIEDWM